MGDRDHGDVQVGGLDVGAGWSVPRRVDASRHRLPVPSARVPGDNDNGLSGGRLLGVDVFTDDGLCHSFSNDASLLLPTHVLTGNYIVLSRPTMMNDDGLGATSSPGFFAVVGVSSTPVTVDISFRGRVRTSADGQVSRFAPGEMGTFTLNQGDDLQIVGGAPPTCIAGSVEGGVTYGNVGSEYDLK